MRLGLGLRLQLVEVHGDKWLPLLPLQPMLPMLPLQPMQPMPTFPVVSFPIRRFSPVPLVPLIISIAVISIPTPAVFSMAIKVWVRIHDWYDVKGIECDATREIAEGDNVDGDGKEELIDDGMGGPLDVPPVLLVTPRSSSTKRTFNSNSPDAS